MCIGIPSRVLRCSGAEAQVQGRDGLATVDLRLVGPVEPGQWLLVFNGAARERLEPERAAEITAALDLLAQGLAGQADPEADPGFALPSAMTAAQLAALSGRA